MSNEQGPEGVEHDPAALHKDHDTVAQQRAEKEEKEKHPKPADHAETDNELAQKGGDPRERKSSERID
jgi:hypothetical protein